MRLSVGLIMVGGNYAVSSIMIRLMFGHKTFVLLVRFVIVKRLVPELHFYMVGKALRFVYSCAVTGAKPGNASLPNLVGFRIAAFDMFQQTPVHIDLKVCSECSVGLIP